VKDFDVTVKLRNNHLVERREALGLSAPQLAVALGIGYGQYLDLENMQASPMSKRYRGEMRPSAQRICDFFGVLPEELWPEQVLKVRRSVLRRKLDYGQMALMASDDMRARRLLPDAAVEKMEAVRDVQIAVARILDPKDRSVIKERFGLDGGEWHTLHEIGEKMGVTGQRVRQREEKALRQLRYSGRSAPLRDFADHHDED